LSKNICEKDDFCIFSGNFGSKIEFLLVIFAILGVFSVEKLNFNDFTTGAQNGYDGHIKEERS
jgi:hypothetical protein